MPIAQVAYGETTPRKVLRCPRCNGKRKAETAWRSGVFEECPYCEGSGKDPHPSLYVYDVPDTAKVGDIVVCPPSEFYDEQRATIIRMGSNGWTGPIKRATLP
jgi:hypothetical protein